MLTGKVAVVTGASSGLGRAIAFELARAGARAVVVADLHEEPREAIAPLAAGTLGGEPRIAAGAPTTAGIEALGAEAAFVRCDVARAEDHERVMAAADAFGGVDVMVNNAGVVGRNALIVDLADDEIEALLAVNVRGVLLGCRAAALRMVPCGSGAILNLSSVVALAGSARTSLYAASKGAVAAASYALAAELGPHGIRVNALHPGIIETAMTTQDQHLAEGRAADTLRGRVPLRRLGSPEDVARTAAFLVGDQAEYVTGTSAVVDGGWSRAL